MTTKRQNSGENPNRHGKRPRKFFVKIERDAAVLEARQKLPVCLHEQEIIEAIHEHDVVLITGATGTGKTTQVPQFLVEDGFGHPSSPSSPGLIVVTQPRRVAAKTCAARVAHELNTNLGGLVGYQVRHDSRIGDDTRVKFSTDGILLREVEHDLLLRKYSAVVIDEAHERSLNTDLLLSFLSRSISLRKSRAKELGHLKLIIMSATLDVDGILSGNNPLFPNPPVINVPSRQFPITVHFAKHTYDDYVTEAFRKVSQIHCRLPPGGILVFLSGREEVERLSSKLRAEFANRKIRVEPVRLTTDTNSDTTLSHTTNPSQPIELRVQILPFYSLLPEPLQKEVFNASVDDTRVRRIIVATNVAETSVTVPGIVYVVDSGRSKERVYKGSGCGRLSAYEVGWVSQASAEQRAGRAGRTAAGHCYRLYSSAVYDQQFAKFRTPEILRVPADTVVLRLRAMGIRYVTKFPFATPPPLNELAAAERLLVTLGALVDSKSSDPKANLQSVSGTAAPKSNSNALLGVTSIGRMLAKLPVEPRLGRLLLAAARLDRDSSTSRESGNEHATSLEDETVIALACRLGGVLTVGTVLQRASGDSNRSIRAKLQNQRSDLLTELAAICAVEHAGKRSGKNSKNSNESSGLDTSAMRSICLQLSLHTKCVFEAIAVAKQVERDIGITQIPNMTLRPPNEREVQRLLRAIVAGFADRIARRMSRDEAAAAGVMPKLMSRAFKAHGVDKPVFIEGGSSVYVGPKVKFVCYASLVEVAVKDRDANNEKHDDYEESDDEIEKDEEEVNDDNNETNRTKTTKKKKDMKLANRDGGSGETEKKIVMRGVSAIDERWVVDEAAGMCEMKKQSDMEPDYDTTFESVTEWMNVFYKGSGWYLGRKRAAVDAVEVMASSNERRRAHGVAFARALLNGRVRKFLKLSKNEARIDVCQTRIGDILAKQNVYSVDTLLKCSERTRRGIVDVIDVCSQLKYRSSVTARWREGLMRMLLEKGTFEKDKMENGAILRLGYEQNEDSD